MIITSIPDYDAASKNGKEPEKESSDARDEWLTISEAARRLGISARAVQMRVTAGKLPSRKDGKRLLVQIREDCAKKMDIGEEGFEKHYEEIARRLREELRDMDETQWNARIDQLKSENAFLRAQLMMRDQHLERRDQAEAELRRLMLADKSELVELRQRLALPPAPEHTSTPEVHTSTRPWWRWWRRK